MARKSRIKVEVNLTFDEFIPRINRAYQSQMKQNLAGLIAENILEGKSPVEGQGRFKKYSAAYAKKKGVSVNDVNLFLTGKMLKSLEVTTPNKKDLKIFFGDFKAFFHDVFGAGRGEVIRRLLPTRSGERFIPQIQNFIEDEFAKDVNDEVKRQNK